MKYLLVVSLSTMLFGCEIGETITGSGNVTKEERSVTGFSSIQVSGPMDVELTQGNEYAIEVMTDDNIIPYVKTEGEGDALRIRMESNTNVRHTKGITIRVTMPQAHELSVSGSGSIKTIGELKNSDRLRLSVSGSGEMEMDVNAPIITGHISGSGKIVAKGKTRKIDVQISGSGDFFAENLMSEEVKASVSGSGKAKVYASRELEVNVSGSGDVYYRGEPSIKKSISGSGTVERLK